MNEVGVNLSVKQAKEQKKIADNRRKVLEAWREADPKTKTRKSIYKPPDGPGDIPQWCAIGYAAYVLGIINFDSYDGDGGGIYWAVCDALALSSGDEDYLIARNDGTQLFKGDKSLGRKDFSWKKLATQMERRWKARVQ